MGVEVNRVDRRDLCHAEPCSNVLDRSCVEESPADCSSEGDRAAYIHRDECVDCRACEPVCPVEATLYPDDVPARSSAFTDDNARFFTDPLPRAQPVASPGGARRIGRVGVDTARVAGYPPLGR